MSAVRVLQLKRDGERRRRCFRAQPASRGVRPRKAASALRQSDRAPGGDPSPAVAVAQDQRIPTGCDRPAGVQREPIKTGGPGRIHDPPAGERCTRLGARESRRARDHRGGALVVPDLALVTMKPDRPGDAPAFHRSDLPGRPLRSRCSGGAGLPAGPLRAGRADDALRPRRSGRAAVRGHAGPGQWDRARGGLVVGEIVAVRVPVVVGANRTVIVQLCSNASVRPAHPSAVIAKSPGSPLGSSAAPEGPECDGLPRPPVRPSQQSADMSPQPGTRRPDPMRSVTRPGRVQPWC